MKWEIQLIMHTMFVKYPKSEQRKLGGITAPKGTGSLF